MTASYRRPLPARVWLWGGLALAWLVPGAAMIAGLGVDWSAADFVMAALLLTALGLGIEGAALMPRRRVAVIVVVAAVALAWVQLAVGIV